MRHFLLAIVMIALQTSLALSDDVRLNKSNMRLLMKCFEESKPNDRFGCPGGMCTLKCSNENSKAFYNGLAAQKFPIHTCSETQCWTDEHLKKLGISQPPKGIHDKGKSTRRYFGQYLCYCEHIEVEMFKGVPADRYECRLAWASDQPKIEISKICYK